ncbi:MAG: hypothetical protein KAI66_22590, partial [Lentisphaeria bacterium]|nr:hypothetical protein [Lentisphaeria bacterium]
LPADCVVIGCSHTHGGPSIMPTNAFKPRDDEYLDLLLLKLVEGAKEAVGAACPVTFRSSVGTAHCGYQRRVCWDDGTHTMHQRGQDQSRMFTGMEGADEDGQLVLWEFVDGEDQTVALMYNCNLHATSGYGGDLFSAGFPGRVREYLREPLGHLPVLFFNGAQGDIAMSNCSSRSNRNAHALSRTSHIIAGEILRLLHEHNEGTDPEVLIHERSLLPVALQQPAPERVAQAQRDMESELDAWRRSGEAELPLRVSMTSFMNFGVAKLAEYCQGRTEEELVLHAFVIGDAAVATLPGEFYVHFGWNIRRRSPFGKTAVFGLCDGYCGYVPTMEGRLTGGYSGEPLYWCRLEANAGYLVVDEASAMLHRAARV